MTDKLRTEGDTRRDWDLVQQDTAAGSASKTERLKIVGGHLYRTTTQQGVALVFVPGNE